MKTKELLKHNLPLYRDQALAHTLTELGLGVEIPPELYEAAAKILLHVAALDITSGRQLWPEGHPGRNPLPPAY